MNESEIEKGSKVVTKKYKMLARYLVSGGVGASIQFGVFYFLNEIVGLWYMYAVFLAFFVALIVAFCLQKFWTFRSFSKSLFKKEFISYTFIAVLGILFNASLMYGMVDIFVMNTILSQVLAIGVIAPISFLLNKRITFAL